MAEECHPILVVTHNNIAINKRCYASLMEQDVLCQPIFIDNGSTDGTKEWLDETCPGFRWTSNEGVSRAWNAGIELAFSLVFKNGYANHVLVANSDVVLAPWTYSLLLSYDLPFVTGVASDDPAQIQQPRPPHLPLEDHPDFSLFLIRRDAWQVPNFEADPAKRQDWIETQIQDGEKWWESQEASGSEKYLDLLSARGPEQAIKSNTLKSDIRKFVETISDIREIGTFGTGAEQFRKTAEMFNKVVKNIYRTSHFPRQARKALQWSVGLSRGYMWPRYIRTEFGWGPGMVEFRDLGPREVLPTQVPTSGDIQGSYAVTAIECMGIAEAHARFPRNQEELVPISKFRYTSPNQVRRHEFWDRHRYGTNTQNWEQQFCEIRHTFIRDLRINRTGSMLPMGDLGTSWYYEVPSVGAIISWKNPENGLPASREATAVNCRVYPQLRRLITNPGMSKPLYDGPDFEWAGVIPTIQYDVDDWPWLAVGYSLLQ